MHYRRRERESIETAGRQLKFKYKNRNQINRTANQKLALATRVQSYMGIKRKKGETVTFSLFISHCVCLNCKLCVLRIVCVCVCADFCLLKRQMQGQMIGESGKRYVPVNNNSKMLLLLFSVTISGTTCNNEIGRRMNLFTCIQKKLQKRRNKQTYKHTHT